MTDVVNVFADDWEEIYPPIRGWRSNTRRLANEVDYFDGEQPKV